MRNKPSFRSKAEYEKYMNYCICLYQTGKVYKVFHTKKEAENELFNENVHGKVMTRKQAVKQGYKF